MKACLALALMSCLVLTSTVSVPQPDKVANEPLADQVRTAIAKGTSYLKNHQKPDGSWDDQMISVDQPGGQTALTVLALLNAGLRPEDGNVKKGLEFLRKLDKPTTYVRALQTMVFVEVGQAQDLERIQKNVKHLRDIAIYDAAGNLLGWGYDRTSGMGRPDNSNTQYALLALWVARQSGIEIDKKFWEQVRRFYTSTQTSAGGWGYDNAIARDPERLSMTVAGLCGLLMAQMTLTDGRETEDPVKVCGAYKESDAIKAGLGWISPPPGSGIDRFALKMTAQLGSTYYNLYGLERLGRLSGLRFFGPHDWYREGCAFLVSKQNKQDGSWADPNTAWDNYPNISTSFALLFLSKGRTPVLISKVAHGLEPRQANDQDWNRRRNELRHLVDFVSAKVFSKLPLSWQIVDMRRQNITTPEQRRQMTSDLLQSPILYMTGHQSLTKQRRLTPVEKELLKEYVENGGFLLGAACCGSKDFAEGFQELCRELWPFNDLLDLEADHPAWNMAFQVKPGAVGLKGIQLGCKTVAILCTDNICGYWEINRHTDEGDVAFKVGANIIAYATGLETPKARLTQFDIGSLLKDNPLQTPPRGYFQVGQLISKIGEEADWKPAPQAMSKLIQHLRETTGLDAIIKTANVPIDHQDLTKYKFLYMHGRKDFKFTSQQLERLRFNLEKTGALLFADACCGKEAFDKGFRQFITDLFPKEAFPEGKVPKLEPIPENDLLYSKGLNGEALTAATIQCRTERGKPPQPMRPSLEGVKIGNRWVVIYSKYDIGCALEKHQSADCIGYNYDSALRLAKAAVLYEFWP